MEFVDAHYHGHEGPTLRDGMDQRVFNKFVMQKMEKRPPEATPELLKRVCVFDMYLFGLHSWLLETKSMYVASHALVAGHNPL